MNKFNYYQLNTFLNVPKAVMRSMSRLKETYEKVESFAKTHDAAFQPVNLGAFYTENGTQYQLLYGVFEYQARSSYDRRQPRIYRWIKNPVLAIERVNTKGGLQPERDVRPVAYEADLRELPRPLVRSLGKHLSRLGRSEKRNGGK